jgi:tetratricopeptide (TPR) repeat protein
MVKNKKTLSNQCAAGRKPTKVGPIEKSPFTAQDWIYAFALFTAIAIMYSPSWNGSQLWDDEGHITKPELRSTNGLLRIWTELGATQQYYPLLHTVFWLEYRIWGENTLGYHLVNILLHFVSALLIVFILRFLKLPGPWFVAAVFALHPMQVESVAWISELKNCLSGVFFFSSILAYLKFDAERKKSLYAIAFVLFVIGLMSKSVIATMPVILLTIFWWKRGRIGWKNDIVQLLPFIAMGIFAGLFTSWVERKFIGAEGSNFSFTIIERCLIAGRVVWFYFLKFFMPINLVFVYPRWQVSQTIWWQYIFPVMTMFLAGALWSIRNRWRAPLAVFLCYAATIFPVMGFFNIYPFRYSFVADHFQYLACIGLIIPATAGIESAFTLLKLKKPSFLRTTIFGIIIFILGAMTWNQSRMYTDIETLYRITLRKNPECWMACLSLGRIVSKTGRQEEAIALYRRAIELKPDYLEAYNNLGNMLRRVGRPEAAIEQYQAAIKINPNKPDAYNNLGITLVQLGRIDEAILQYKKALEINPDKINTLNNLAGAYVQKKQLNEAISLLQKALSLAKAERDISLARGITANLEYLNQENGKADNNKEIQK